MNIVLCEAIKSSAGCGLELPSNSAPGEAQKYYIIVNFIKLDILLLFTPSLNDVFEIKNELKKLHIEPFLYMPRYYKNAKKQIFSWKKIIYTIIFCVLLPLIGKSAS